MAEHGRIAAYEVMIVQRLIQALQANISQLSNGLGRFMTVPWLSSGWLLGLEPILAVVETTTRSLKVKPLRGGQPRTLRVRVAKDREYLGVKAPPL